MWTQAIHFFFNPHFRPSGPDEARRAQLAVGIALMLFALGLLYAPLFFLVFDNHLSAWGCVLLTVLSAGALMIFRKYGRLAFLVNANICVMLLAQSINAFTTGGVDSPLLTGYLIVPVAATLLSGSRSGRRWTMVALAGVVCFGAVKACGLILVRFYPGEFEIFFQTSMAATVIAILMMLVLLLQAGLDHTLQLLHQANLDLAAALQQSDNLLLNILPISIAQRLKLGDLRIADGFPEATVLFADMVDFAPLSATMTPGQVASMLNDVFTHFDQLVDKFGLEKIKTIGDCYMVAAGIPQPRPNHAQIMVELALEIQAVVRLYSP